MCLCCNRWSLTCIQTPLYCSSKCFQKSQKSPFTPFCWTFGYRFEPALFERSSSGSVYQRSNSVPDSLLSMELSVLARTRRVEKRGLFSLNEIALEYLEDKSTIGRGFGEFGLLRARENAELKRRHCPKFK
ncbi:hypothetical protein OS493_028186 [Desmophyllum pertusum]|uniref:Uncharacterized protein n=1 Tax=Desmophyllum pertusum TaxID=174260 RepID=A0A9X0CRN4_9CNID|nr:hypothetical protein OS493_028186 [Desmophyllum pertusum]